MKAISIIIKCRVVAPEKLPKAKTWNISLGQGYISGNVIANKVPAKNMIVDLFDSGLNRVRQTRTDSLGSYSFEGIDHNQPYDVVVYDENREWEKKVSSHRYPQVRFNNGSSPFKLSEGNTIDMIFSVFPQFDVSNTEGASAEFRILDLKKHNRVYFNTGFSNTYIAFIELEFMLNGNVIPPVGGTVLKSSELDNDQHSANNAFDGITSASINRPWATTLYGIPAFIGYSFPEAVAVDQFRIWPRDNDNTHISQSPKEMIFQTSDDGTTWKNIFYTFIPTNDWNEDTPKVFGFGFGKKRYWGIVIDSRYAIDYQVITELEMYEDLDGPNLCTGGSGISNSTIHNWDAGRAFDGIKTGYQGWCSEAYKNTELLLAYDFRKETKINHIKVLANNTDVSYNFKKATVVSSIDGITWEPEWEIPEQPVWALSEERVFSRP